MQAKLLKNPLFLFYILLALLSCWPVLNHDFFPTMDGPAHLYNAQLIKSLWLGTESLQDYFLFNPEPIPNWTGHGILAGLLTLGVPPELAEKTLLLIICLGLPFAFFILVTTINNGNLHPLSILILPFIYTFLLALGFYNFSLGLVCFLFALNQWYLWLKKPSFSNGLLLFLFVGLTYFSHVLPFVFLCLSSGIIYLLERNKAPLKTESILLAKTILLFSPFLFLFIRFYFSRKGVDTSTYLPLEELLSMIYHMRALVVYNFDEEWYTYVLASVIGLILIIQATQIKRASIAKHLSLIILTVLSLLLLFIIPDGNSGGSYVSQRISLFFFLYLILLCCRLPFKLITAPLIVIFIGAHFYLVKFYNTVIYDLNVFAHDVVAAGSLIPEGSSIAPIHSSYNWLSPHFSNYLGISKPVVVLENYEASTDYFPLTWNYDALPNFSLAANACRPWESNADGPILKPDYISIIGKKPLEACDSLLQKSITEDYILLTDKNTFIKLYEIKK